MLEEENSVLRALLTQMKLDPMMASRLKETLEPISKVLNNDL